MKGEKEVFARAPPKLDRASMKQKKKVNLLLGVIKKKKTTTKRTTSHLMGKAGNNLCKRCGSRFGSRACFKRLCGQCCALPEGGGGRGGGNNKSGDPNQRCVAHHSSRREAMQRKQSALFPVGSAGQKQQQRAGKKKRKLELAVDMHPEQAAGSALGTKKKRHKMGEASQEDEHEDGLEVVARQEESDGEGDVAWRNGLGAVVAIQAEEVVRLRRELKRIRRAFSQLKRKRVSVQQGLCIICEERGLNVLLVPCGHCYCRECVASLASCPICHTEVQRHYNYHLPAYVCDEAVVNLLPSHSGGKSLFPSQTY